MGEMDCSTRFDANGYLDWGIQIIDLNTASTTSDILLGIPLGFNSGDAWQRNAADTYDFCHSWSILNYFRAGDKNTFPATNLQFVSDLDWISKSSDR